MRRETAVQSPLQRTAGTGLMESTPPASLDALPQEKNNEEGNHCSNLRGALGSRVSVFPAMDQNNMNICCSKLNHTNGRLFCLENRPSHIEIFHTCNNKPHFAQHYTFYVHQTNSLKFPVRSSISYSHCSGITFLAPSTAGTMTGLLMGPIGHRLCV